jgi:hypothetical protein
MKSQKYNELIESRDTGKIFEDNVYHQKSGMEDHKPEILAELERTPPQAVRGAAVIIERVRGIKRNIPRVRGFLKKRV